MPSLCILDEHATPLIILLLNQSRFLLSCNFLFQVLNGNQTQRQFSSHLDDFMLVYCANVTLLSFVLSVKNGMLMLDAVKQFHTSSGVHFVVSFSPQNI